MMYAMYRMTSQMAIDVYVKPLANAITPFMGKCDTPLTIRRAGELLD